jgi:hypothetical protein
MSSSQAHPAVARQHLGHKLARWFFMVVYCSWVLSGLLPGHSDGPSQRKSTFPSFVADALSTNELWSLREDAREAFYHAYDSYMTHAYPWDELKPLSCMGRRWDRRERGTLDDSLGGKLRGLDVVLPPCHSVCLLA